MSLTSKQLERNRNAPRTHGIYAFRDNGPEALDASKVGSLQELRELVSTQPGRMELRQEMAARVALICYLAYGEMVEVADEKGKSIFDAPVTKRAGTWFAELRRLLDAWPDDDDSANVLEGLQNGD